MVATSYTVTITDDRTREQAITACKRAPIGYRVTFKEAKRSEEQSRKMHAMVRDVARQLDYYGARRSEEAWKRIFAASVCGAEMLPNLDGDGFVQITRSTADMSKAELSAMIDLIEAYGAKHGVQWRNEREAA